LARRPTIDDPQSFPRMTRWFDPVLLCKLLLRVLVADVFGQYADRRLMMAALDPAPEDELLKRCELDRDPAAPRNEIWIDYVADLGDGFDATYAIASLLARDDIAIDGHDLARGEALIMGGDQVYPTSTSIDYLDRLFWPYGLALPPRPGGRDLPVFMIPGNHDWYDGLMMFLAFFCRARPTRTKRVQWRTPQRRSYFALRLTDKWWLWGIDIALNADLDQPQADYFAAVAKRMPPGSHIILCGAEPSWYKADIDGAASYRSLSYAASIAKNDGADLDIPVLLSGDSHHYARYESGDGRTQFITSGGGGAFLHGTNHLKDTIKAKTRWLRHELTVALKACYPGREESRRLLRGDLRFPLLNWDFGLALGVVYWLAALPMLCWPGHGHVWTFAALLLGLGGYTFYQERDAGQLWKNWVSIPHVAVHWAAIAGMGGVFARVNAQLPSWSQGWEIPFWLFAVEMIAVGGVVAGFIFGLFLFLTCRFYGMNSNDAFSAMRLDSHRHFLRLHIEDDTLTVYPIALDRVPERADWEPNPAAGPTSAAPILRPTSDLRPRLIEPGIVVRPGKNAGST